MDNFGLPSRKNTINKTISIINAASISMKASISTTIPRLLIYSLLYAIISYSLFVFSSGGWHQIIFLYFGFIFWITLLLIFSVSLLIRWRIKKKNLIFINADLLKLALATQILTILFNQSDCGDNPGSYPFFQIVFFKFHSNARLCSQETSSRILTFWILCLLIYLTLVLINFVILLLQPRIVMNVKDDYQK